MGLLPLLPGVPHLLPYADGLHYGDPCLCCLMQMSPLHHTPMQKPLMAEQKANPSNPYPQLAQEEWPMLCPIALYHLHSHQGQVKRCEVFLQTFGRPKIRLCLDYTENLCSDLKPHFDSPIVQNKQRYEIQIPSECTPRQLHNCIQWELGLWKSAEMYKETMQEK